MEVRVKALASGSSGNAYLIQAGEAALLVDAGLPAQSLERYLRAEGVGRGTLAAVLVSHEHTDHAQGAVPLARRYGVPLMANRATLECLGVLPTKGTGAGRGKAGSAVQEAPAEPEAPPATEILPTGRTRQVGPFEVTSFRLPHDAAEPVGFSIACDGWQLCVATDLGEPCAALVEAIRRADLVILEANHDPVRLRNGYYPAALKQRIAGRQGHLSNDQAASALVESMAALPSLALKSVWLAHLSRHNNTRALALQAVEGALLSARLRRHVGDLAVIARDRPSLEWRAACVQRSLF